ncbi:WD40 repeat protein [Microbacterium sp. W4I4]|uniref:carbohydrate binding domain-containing protein n=1 Tax=Microbacterium sp. W4I4 TaxID=3042295 RepID=UPI00277F2AC9|nr:carbohydrate binding domain-containing protein [Microbacterium sp. W4I4]MDQ0614477.1 WD40 repeat protein [Microbacterium sp. W4I4]
MTTESRTWAGRLAAGLVAVAMLAAGATAAHANDAPADSNLLTNASFEEGTGPEDAPGWSPLWNRTEITTFSSARASDGVRSLHLFRDASIANGGLVADAVPVTPGATVEFSFDQFLVSGGPISATVHFDDADGNLIVQPYELLRTDKNTWGRASAEFVAPDGTATASAVLYVSSGVMIDTFVDDVYFGPATAKPEEPELSPVDKILVQDERIEHLGTPVTSQIPSQAAQGIEEGQQVSYQVFKGNPQSGYPATFAVTDVRTGAQLRTCTVDGADHARNLNIASDGRVYWGTYHDSKLWRYDPATGECTDLGTISDEKDSMFGMSPGPNGTMYIGSYPDARLFLFDPATDKVEFLRSIGDGIDYIHSIAYHQPSDTLYIGSGGQVPQIWKIADGGRGEQTLIADETTVPRINEGTQFVGRMDIVGDRVIAQVGLRMLVLDLDGNIVHWDADQTRFFFGHHIIEGASPDEAIFSSGGGALMRYDIAANTFESTGITIGGYLSNGVVDDSSGQTLLYGTSASGVFVADLAAGTLISEEAIEFAQPTLIQKLFRGVDDTVWASGYMIGLAEVDKDGGSHGPTLQRGQFESAAVRDGKMYLGGYGHARFDVLDPATYDPADAGTVPTLFSGVDEGQDRPFGMAYNPDRDEIYMGSVATYGQTQGALAIWDGASGEHVILTSEIGEDENIISVAYNPVDGLVYLGSTVDGGLGSVPSGHTAGKLIVFDPETRSVVKTLDPAGEEREGISGLMVDPDGVVWGVAEDVLFAYDPATGESTVKATVGGRYSAGTTYWAYGTVNRSSADGRIYVTAGYRFSVFDPATGQATRIANGLQWSTVDGEGDVYLSAGANLFRYDVEEVEWARCTEKPTADIVDGLIVRSGEVVCIDGIRVDEGVVVEAGGTLLMRDADVRGGMQSDGAERIEVRGTEVRGAVSVTATAGAFVFAGNEVHGSLQCGDNAAAPENETQANLVSGSLQGQCLGL